VAQAHFILGDIAMSEGDLAVARSEHETALSIRRELNEQRTLMESRVGMAGVFLESGQLDEAEKQLREIIEDMDLEMTGPTSAMARVLLARTHLAQKRNREAAEALSRAKGIVAETQRNIIRSEIAITDAYVEAAAGHAQPALRSLAELLETAIRNGSVHYEFSIRLALGRIELEYGDPEAGRARLAALRDDAARKGFGRIAAAAGRPAS
jgi:tetratricopeptide (TPR) repeat protein